MTLTRTPSRATPHDRRTRVLEALEARPEGMTARELSDCLNLRRWTINTVLEGLYVRRLVGRQSFMSRTGQVWRWQSARLKDDEVTA